VAGISYFAFSFLILALSGISGAVRIEWNVPTGSAGIATNGFLAVGAFSFIVPFQEISPRMKNPRRIEPSTTTKT
jgi:hypothetical protein